MAISSQLLGCSEPDAVETSTGFAIEKKSDFFSHDKLFYVRIDGWDPNKMSPASLREYQQKEGARVRIYQLSDPNNTRHCPASRHGDLLYESRLFKMRTSGNLTNGTPKSSYKIKLTGNKSQRFLKMKTLNLKSMWNDVSQMREALAWDLFAKAEVPSPGHSYARFCINDRYYGLFSVIEQVDKSMLKGDFGKLDEGNLYKAYWGDEDLGPADLAYRKRDGKDDGRAYWKNRDIDKRSYRLKSNDDESELNTYDDLATLIRVINGRTMSNPRDPDFESAAYQQAVDAVFDARGFLRWASVNSLLGAWDNYYGTPANYYLYNSGVSEDESFVEKPYFNWIPWDYDNTFGIDFFNTQWHTTGLVNWSKHTRTDSKALPMITNLLKNKSYLAYYLDHTECLLDTSFNAKSVRKQIGDEEGRRGLWSLIRQSVYLESDSERQAPHTGRQFTNEQVYWNGFRHEQLQNGAQFILGIEHHVRARHDSARSQIDWLRERNGLHRPSEPVCAQ